MKTTLTAGTIVVSDKGNVLVVNQNGDSWSLPKGHVDPGETAWQAAERETAEESGIKNLEFVKKLGEYERPQIGVGGIGENENELKHITIFLAKAKQTAPKPEDPNNPEARWLRPKEVPKLLTHPKDVEFYKGVLPEILNLIKNA